MGGGGEDEVAKIGQVEIRMAKFLAVGEARKVIYGLFLALKREPVSVVSNHRVQKY